MHADAHAYVKSYSKEGGNNSYSMCHYTSTVLSTHTQASTHTHAHAHLELEGPPRDLPSSPCGAE